MKKIDENLEIGNLYGDLKIIRFVRRQSGCLVYLAECQICHRQREVWIKDVKRGIGCHHDNCIQLVKTDEYVKKLRTIWSHMVDRCTNPNCEHYDVYGGRGITCDYKYFIDFYDDMFESFKEHVSLHGFKNTTIDRINVDGNYTKENLRWATWETQWKNTSIIKFYKATKNNIEMYGTCKELSEKIGCNPKSLRNVANPNTRDKSIFGWNVIHILKEEYEKYETRKEKK